MSVSQINGVWTVWGDATGSSFLNKSAFDVKRYGSGGQTFTIIDLKGNSLSITGKLLVDLRKYLFIGSGLTTVQSTGILRLGSQVTAYSDNFYPRGTGWITTRTGTQNYEGGGLDIYGALEIYGGTITSSSAIHWRGNAWRLKIRKGHIQSSDPSNEDLRLRFDTVKVPDVIGPDGPPIDVEDLIVTGFQIDLQENQPANFQRVEARKTKFALHFREGKNPVNIFSVPEKVGVSAYANNWRGGSDTKPVGQIRFYNCVNPGGNIVPQGTSQYGGEEYTQYKFTFQDENKNIIGGVIAYTKDVNNGKRTQDPNKITTNQGVRNFFADQVNMVTSKADGTTDKVAVLVAFNYRSDNGSGNLYSLNGNEVIDRRTDSDGNVLWKFIGYPYQILQLRITSKTITGITTTIVLKRDPNITEIDITKVRAYTKIESVEQLYHYSKMQIYDNYAGETELEVERLSDGSYSIHGDEDVLIDSNAVEVLSHDHGKVTIKGGAIKGRLSTGGIISFSGDGALPDGYTDFRGDTSISVPGSGFQSIDFYSTSVDMIGYRPGDVGTLGQASPGGSVRFLFSALKRDNRGAGPYLYYVVNVDGDLNYFPGKMEVLAKGFHILELDTRSQIATVLQAIADSDVVRKRMEDKIDDMDSHLKASGLHPKKEKDDVVKDFSPPTSGNFWNSGSKFDKISVSRGSVNGIVLSPDNSGVFQIVYHAPQNIFFTHVFLSGSITGTVRTGYNITISVKIRGQSYFSLLHSSNPGRAGFSSPFTFSVSDTLRKIYGKDYRDVSEIEFTITPNNAFGTSNNQMTITELKLHEIVYKTVTVGTEYIKTDIRAVDGKSPALAQFPQGGGGLSADDVKKIDNINTQANRLPGIESDTAKLVGIERTIITIDRTTEAIEVESEKIKDVKKVVDDTKAVIDSTKTEVGEIATKTEAIEVEADKIKDIKKTSEDTKAVVDSTKTEVGEIATKTESESMRDEIIQSMVDDS